MTRQKEQDIWEFKRLYKELDDIYHDIALEFGISDSAFNIFYAIAELGDGCLQTDISYASFTSKQTINSSIRKLKQDGYIYLEQGQGRDKHIHLTDVGKKFVQEKILTVIKIEDDAFLTFNNEERYEFLRLFKKYMDNFKKRGKKMHQMFSSNSK